MTPIQTQGQNTSTRRRARGGKRPSGSPETERLSAELDRLTSASEALTGALSELLLEIGDLRTGLQDLRDRLDDREVQGAAAKRATSDARGERGSQAVRLLATQMLAAGSTRDEARARLAEEFGIADSEQVLDGIDKLR